MLKVLLGTLSIVLTAPAFFGADSPATSIAASVDSATQVASGSREALRPRNNEERAIADFFARLRAVGKPLQPGEVAYPPALDAGPPPPPGAYVNAVDEFRAAVCRADLVATGELQESRVFFNSGETFLITVYNFRVDVGTRQPIATGTTVRIALAGGEAMLDGQKTIARQPFVIPSDQPAIVWLKRIPDTQVYGLAADASVVTVEDGRPRSANPNYLRLLQQPDTLGNLWTAISNAAASCKGR
jgi:hypothetical protein